MRRILRWLWQFPQNICGLLYGECIERDIICTINQEKDYTTFLVRGHKDRVIGEYMYICQDFTYKGKIIERLEEYIKMSRKYGIIYFIVLLFKNKS